mmetsp:Transcript_38977/g.87155  ORF Transcript_38977/g.87155 Transcript_38977/m.87155 type:complete len:298 (-) Transcript_38977:341-1234(-)
MAPINRSAWATARSKFKFKFKSAPPAEPGGMARRRPWARADRGGLAAELSTCGARGTTRSTNPAATRPKLEGGSPAFQSPATNTSRSKGCCCCCCCCCCFVSSVALTPSVGASWAVYAVLAPRNSSKVKAPSPAASKGWCRAPGNASENLRSTKESEGPVKAAWWLAGWPLLNPTPPPPPPPLLPLGALPGALPEAHHKSRDPAACWPGRLALPSWALALVCERVRFHQWACSASFSIAATLPKTRQPLEIGARLRFFFLFFFVFAAAFFELVTVSSFSAAFPAALSPRVRLVWRAR